MLRVGVIADAPVVKRAIVHVDDVIIGGEIPSVQDTNLTSVLDQF